MDLPRSRGRRHSIDSGNQPSSTQNTELKCPKFRQFYASPRVLPCGHRACKRCIDRLHKKSGDDASRTYFHCPVQACNQLCATTSDSLRGDRDLERAVLHGRRRLIGTNPVRCQQPGCDSTDGACERCPHCEHRLCGDHIVDHGRIIVENCTRRLHEMNDLSLAVEAALDECKLINKNVENQIQSNKETFEQLRICLDRQFREREKDLLLIKRRVEASESSLLEFGKRISELQYAINEALEVDENDQDSLKEKQQLINSAEHLGNSMKLPKLPDDVRFNETPADLELIEEKIKELKVLQTSLEVQTVEDSKLTIACPEVASKPHHGVLWSNTVGFGVNARGHVQGITGKAQDIVALPDEVLLVTNRMKFFAVSLAGQHLGQIKVGDLSPFIVNWFDVSPDGKLLALLSTNERKVLLCDMEGSVQATIGHNVLEGIHSLCSVTLSGKWLTIVDSGNTNHRKPGTVWLLEGPRFDPERARRIPLETFKRKIFPTAATCTRGSFFVLADRMPGKDQSTANELLMHDRGCRFVADVCQGKLQSALHACSDASGRIFIGVNKGRTASDAEGSRPPAEVVVMDPQGRQIGLVRDPAMTSCHGISYSEQRGRPNRLVVCDPSDNKVHVYQLA